MIIYRFKNLYSKLVNTIIHNNNNCKISIFFSKYLYELMKKVKFLILKLVD